MMKLYNCLKKDDEGTTPLREIQLDESSTDSVQNVLDNGQESLDPLNYSD
jgi:hypothetical protein